MAASSLKRELFLIFKIFHPSKFLSNGRWNFATGNRISPLAARPTPHGRYAPGGPSTLPDGPV